MKKISPSSNENILSPLPTPHSPLPIFKSEPDGMRSQSKTLNEEDEEEAGFEMKSDKPEAISHKP